MFSYQSFEVMNLYQHMLYG